MDQFGPARRGSLAPVSIKIRINSGCFHREHSKEAYAMIDDYVRQADLSDIHYQIVEHETGPEILVYLAVTAAGLGVVAAGLGFAKSVVELITAIIKARSEGIKRGDVPDDPLELIVRGYSKDREYFEEKVLRISPKSRVTTKQISEALSKLDRKEPRKGSKKAR